MPLSSGAPLGGICRAAWALQGALPHEKKEFLQGRIGSFEKDRGGRGNEDNLLPRRWELEGHH